MRSFVNNIFRTAIPIAIGMCCFFYASFLNGQTRFNVRSSLDFGSNIARGIYETENSYAVTGGGVVVTDTGNYQVIYHSFYDLEGVPLNVRTFSKEVSIYVFSALGGLEYSSPELNISGVGQTYDETTESAAGFIASFNEEGDTNSVILFHSPYIEEYGEDFIAPLTIEPSTNSDNSFFVSSNIFKMEGGTGTDCWIQRMTPEGESLWNYIYATEANPDQCMSMIATDEGGVLLGIWQFGPIEIFTKFIELDAMGNELSQITIETASRVNKIIRSNEEGVIMASATPNGSEGLIGAIYKFSFVGDLEWDVLLGDDAPFGFTQEFTNLVHTQDGNYVAGGVNYEYVANPTDSTGTNNRNGWLVKVSDDGEVLWDRKYSFVNSPQDNHTLNDLKATSDGGFIFCGEATDLDPDLTYSEGPPQQGWLVKVDEHGCLVEGCQLSDNVNELSAEQKEYFKAGPIPAGQFLNIYQSATAHLSTYQLINSTGQVVEEFPSMSKGTTLMLDVSNYPVGGYQLVLSKGNELLQSKKILIE